LFSLQHLHQFTGQKSNTAHVCVCVSYHMKILAVGFCVFQ
jgi:hypothetical protein